MITYCIKFFKKLFLEAFTCTSFSLRLFLVFISTRIKELFYSLDDFLAGRTGGGIPTSGCNVMQVSDSPSPLGPTVVGQDQSHPLCGDL